MKFVRHSGLLLAVALLAGCATAPKPLYSWDNYQSTIYQYYQLGETGPEQQIATLKASIEKSRSKGLPVPPGLHAHLGMLYSNTGQMDLAMAEFEAEKAQYPESATFMDFLTHKNKGAIK